MDKKEFIKKMNEYNYTDEQIEDFIQLAEDCKKLGMEIKYEDIVLEQMEV